MGAEKNKLAVAVGTGKPCKWTTSKADVTDHGALGVIIAACLVEKAADLDVIDFVSNSTGLTLGVPLVCGITKDVPTKVDLGKLYSFLDLAREEDVCAVAGLAELGCMDQLMADCVCQGIEGLITVDTVVINAKRHDHVRSLHIAHQTLGFLAFLGVGLEADAELFSSGHEGFYGLLSRVSAKLMGLDWCCQSHSSGCCKC